VIHLKDSKLQIDHKITYLVGDGNISNKAISPYSDIVCNFLADISIFLKKQKNISDFTDLIAFSFWCRRANLAILKKKFYQSNKMRIGRGLVFHITPSNVPVNFAYSLCFGLIAGNSNILRVSSQDMPQVDMICSVINILLKQAKYKEMLNRISVVQYEYSDQVTSILSSICDARIIWGGDKTIHNIRQLQISPRCVDIAFSDRYSISVIDANVIDKLTIRELSKLAASFYNDSYTMDQNACSSPHIVFWNGSGSIEGKKRFWNAVYEVAASKYDLTEIKSIDKYTKFLDDSINDNNIRKVVNMKNILTYVEIKELDKNLHHYRGVNGLFYSFELDDINSLAHIVTNKYQTLTYYGIDRSLLEKFIVDNSVYGIDRIVPVGRALDMDVVWDGYDVIGYLSRIVDVK
jgi:hypothetical protein